MLPYSRKFGRIFYLGWNRLFEDGELEGLFLDAEFFAGVEGLDLAGALVAVAFVPGDEFGAGGDDGDLDAGAVMAAGEVIGGGEELFADPGALLGGKDAEETEIEFTGFLLEIDAAEEGAGGAGVFEEGGAGAIEELFDAGGVGSGAGDEVAFAGPALLAFFPAIGAVDEGDESGDVGWSGGGDGHR